MINLIRFYLRLTLSNKRGDEVKKSLPVLGRPVLILKIKRHTFSAEKDFFDCFMNLFFCMFQQK
jgi:hypothetical protein